MDVEDAARFTCDAERWRADVPCSRFFDIRNLELGTPFAQHEARPVASNRIEAVVAHGEVDVVDRIPKRNGIAYGRVAGTLNKADDIVGWMTESMRRMGPYIILILVISQFIRAFQWAHLDKLIAVGGAEVLRALGMEQLPIPFFIAFICIVAVANLFMGSASAKWAIFAPIFVPMFMGLDIHPGFTQLLYRIGDSITNCVSPLYPFSPILLG